MSSSWTPTPPRATASSLLYSREFYAVIKRHLRSDGVLQIWYPESGAMQRCLPQLQDAERILPLVRAFQSFDDFWHSLPCKHGASARGIRFSFLAGSFAGSGRADFLEWKKLRPPHGALQPSTLSRAINREDLAENPRCFPRSKIDQPINEYFKLRSWFHLLPLNRAIA